MEGSCTLFKQRGADAGEREEPVQTLVTRNKHGSTRGSLKG
jgi:hypothetical protein